MAVVLQCYDFDNSKTVGLDEVVLALKSALCGLSKLTGEPILSEEQIEVLVSTVSHSSRFRQGKPNN
jgi:hypothetical protein